MCRRLAILIAIGFTAYLAFVPPGTAARRTTHCTIYEEASGIFSGWEIIEWSHPGNVTPSACADFASTMTKNGWGDPSSWWRYMLGWFERESGRCTHGQLINGICSEGRWLPAGLALGGIRIAANDFPPRVCNAYRQATHETLSVFDSTVGGDGGALCHKLATLNGWALSG
jgi:hypothetical protein